MRETEADRGRGPVPGVGRGDFEGGKQEEGARARVVAE